MLTKLTQNVKVAVYFLPWILAAFVLAALSSINLLPDSHWFEVNSIHVDDTSVGTSPRMVVDRAVHSEFVADWVVSVRKVEPDKSMTSTITVCTAWGRSDYLVNTMVPDNLNLKWWMRGVSCPLAPGEYYVTTKWVLNIMGASDRVINASSNVFTVRPAVGGVPSDEDNQSSLDSSATMALVIPSLGGD